MFSSVTKPAIVLSIAQLLASVCRADDIDGDGVPEPGDVCPNTPPGIPVDSAGRPRGDLDLDCDVDMDDVVIFQTAFTGPLNPLVEVCNDGIDNDGDGLVDCQDVADCPAGVACGAHAVCAPTQSCECDSLWGDCNGDPLDGCETHLTTLTHCGACNSACSLANATESCATGACVITGCNTGWCNDDGLDANGCEFSLNSNPPCAPTLYLGAVSGDDSSPPLTFVGHGERWFSVDVREDALFPDEDLLARITLQSAAATNYDLYVYCESCGGTLIGSSTNGTGLADVVPVGRQDNAADRSFTLYIEIRYQLAGCEDYTLTVDGDVGSLANTCP